MYMAAVWGRAWDHWGCTVSGKLGIRDTVVGYYADDIIHSTETNNVISLSALVSLLT